MSLTKIRSVDPDSPARRAGVRIGETLTEVNGHPIVDVLDYKFHTYDPRLILKLKEENGRERTVRVRKAEGEDLGLNFETYLMDRARSCANRCIFCFVDQMPPGMRETLYFKDDDARLSFLMGNYITLTNLSRRELQRIMDLHISPVNISVHATDPELRASLLKNHRAGECLSIMEQFARAGITMNCQVVSCPGINDGPELERTMRDLASLAPHALTVALVPVGLTKYREHLYPLRPYTQEEAEQVIRQAEAFQKEMLAAHGTRFVFPSDEFYQIAKHPLPDVDSYEDFPQFENGVGLLCRLKDEYETAVRLDPDEGQAEKRRVIMACGTSVAPFLRELITSHPVSGVDIRIKPIVNYFFGETVTVSGLITGQDLVAQLKGEEADEILITESMLRQGEEIFLDDMTLEQAQRQLGIRITPVPDDGADLLYALRGTEE